jgi:hypothetical protein
MLWPPGRRDANPRRPDEGGDLARGQKRHRCQDGRRAAHGCRSPYGSRRRTRCCRHAPSRPIRPWRPSGSTSPRRGYSASARLATGGRRLEVGRLAADHGPGGRVGLEVADVARPDRSAADRELKRSSDKHRYSLWPLIAFSLWPLIAFLDNTLVRTYGCNSIARFASSLNPPTLFFISVLVFTMSTPARWCPSSFRSRV